MWGKGFSSWLWICAFNNSFKTIAPSLASFRFKSLLWKLSLTTQSYNRLRVLDCVERVLGTLSLWQATTLPLELLKILCTGKVMEVWSCTSNFRQLLYIFWSLGKHSGSLQLLGAKLQTAPPDASNWHTFCLVLTT